MLNHQQLFGLVEPATWLFFSLVSAVTMGFSVQVAHFIGANDFAKARAVMRHGYIFGLCFALFFIADNFFLSVIAFLYGWVVVLISSMMQLFTSLSSL